MSWRVCLRRSCCGCRCARCCLSWPPFIDPPSVLVHFRGNGHDRARGRVLQTSRRPWIGEKMDAHSYVIRRCIQGQGKNMNFHRIAMRSAMAAGCLWLAGCAQDTPKSVLQNSNEYATRVFVPSTLSGSVRDALAKPENKPLTFNKITFSRKTTMTYNGTPVEMSGDVTYENVGNGLVR